MPAVERLERNSKVAAAAVNDPQIKQFARSINRFEWVFDTFDDPLLYPGREVEPDLAANFFLFLVAIDHRTHSPGQVFNGKVRGIELMGSELLWALAKVRLDENPDFFSPT